MINAAMEDKARKGEVAHASSLRHVDVNKKNQDGQRGANLAHLFHPYPPLRLCGFRRRPSSFGCGFATM